MMHGRIVWQVHWRTVTHAILVGLPMTKFGTDRRLTKLMALLTSDSINLIFDIPTTNVHSYQITVQ